MKKFPCLPASIRYTCDVSAQVFKMVALYNEQLRVGIVNAVYLHMKKTYLIAMISMLLWPICLKADGQKPEANVNERYVVESVVCSGIDESKISQPLREEAQKMVGVKYSEQTANGILGKLREEVKKENYQVSLKVEKGNNPDMVKVVFQFKKNRFVLGSGAGGVYHSQEGISGGISATIDELTYHNVFSFKLASDANTLLERYAGITASYENKKVGTEKVSLHFDFSSFHEKFNAATKTALTLRPDVPGVYRARQSISPSIALKPFPNKYVGIDVKAGLDFQRLEFQTPDTHTRMANVGYTNVILNTCNDQGKYKGCLIITYNLRTATRSLDSDFVYTRHFLLVSPWRTQGAHTFSANFSYGWITGTPPLFERFAMGNTSTLRGWNKFDVSPLGGTHEAHGSLEYRYRHFKVFYDVGTEWDKNQFSPVRHGLGIGFINWPFKSMSVSLAFPLRQHNVKPAWGVF
jgi:outer membrane translocation and assembly module TamA